MHIDEKELIHTKMLIIVDFYKNEHFKLRSIPEYLLKPSILQATCASLFVKPILHTVPHVPLYKISMRPPHEVPLTTRAVSSEPAKHSCSLDV